MIKGLIRSVGVVALLLPAGPVMAEDKAILPSHSFDFECDSAINVFNRVSLSANEAINFIMAFARRASPGAMTGVFILFSDGEGNSETISMLLQPIIFNNGSPMPPGSIGAGRHILVIYQGDPLVDTGSHVLKENIDDIDMNSGTINVKFNKNNFIFSYPDLLTSKEKMTYIPTKLTKIRNIALSCAGGEYLLKNISYN